MTAKTNTLVTNDVTISRHYVHKKRKFSSGILQVTTGNNAKLMHNLCEFLSLPLIPKKSNS